jgi:hypothetical protein
MIKIYVDSIKFDYAYVEDELSSFDILEMEKDEFAKYIKKFCEKWGSVHTCYGTFINQVSIFVREYGHDWLGDEFKIFAPESPGDYPYKEYHFNEKGYLVDLPHGIFG